MKLPNSHFHEESPLQQGNKLFQYVAVSQDDYIEDISSTPNKHDQCGKVNKQKKTRAKDVFPNINRTQAAEITPPPGSDVMVPSAAE